MSMLGRRLILQRQVCGWLKRRSDPTSRDMVFTAGECSVGVLQYVQAELGVETIEGPKMDVSGRKCAWVLHLVPEWCSIRPLVVMCYSESAQTFGIVLLDWHNLDVATGMFKRFFSRQAIFSRTCCCSKRIELSGDELHALGACESPHQFELG